MNLGKPIFGRAQGLTHPHNSGIAQAFIFNHAQNIHRFKLRPQAGMFHNPGITRPDVQTMCNGFAVRIADSGYPAVHSSNWPYWSYSGLPNTNAYYSAPAHYIRPYISRSNSSGYAWSNIPVSAQKHRLDKSDKQSRPPSKKSPPSSGNSGKPSDSIKCSNASNSQLESVQYPSDIALHQQLQWHHTWTSFSSGLVWDIARPPSAAKTITSRLVIVNPDFNVPIMHKTIEHFELWTDHPVLDCYIRSLNWGPVPMPKKNPTIIEFLQAIYEYLGTRLTREDLKFICSTPQNSELLERARKGRVEDGFDAVSAAAAAGPFRRSDVLGSHRRFQGARVVKMGDGSDRLYFNVGRGPVPRI